MMKAPKRTVAAGPFLILALSSAPLLPALPYQVSGVAVDARSHRPLAHALVSLAPATARDRKLELFTAADGRFAFLVDRAGKYSLSLTKPGYLTQAYKQVPPSGYATAIVVRDDQDTSHIVFEAIRESVLYGSVKSEDSEPVGHALVATFQSVIVDGERRVVIRRQTRANALGEFRIFNLSHGNYYVCAMGRPWFADSLIGHEEFRSFRPSRPRGQGLAPGSLNVPQADSSDSDQPELKYNADPNFRGTAFMTTCFPSARSAEEASLVRLNAGSETQISITLPYAKAVSLKGAVNLGGPAGDGRAALVKKIYGQSMPFLETLVVNGAFDFENVPAGSYEIVATSQASSGASSWAIRQEVEVGSFDSEITLRTASMGSFAGRLLFQGQPPASMPNLVVLLRDDEAHPFQTQVASDGNFSLSRLPPGRYQVTAGSQDYVAAYLTGPAGERLPLTLDVTSGESIRRDLTVTQAMSMIEGTVEKAGLPQIGAFVVLTPKDASERWASRIDQSDSDGSYRLAAIPPGDYFLVALSSGEDIAYRDPSVAAVISKVGKPVHVEAGAHLEQHIDLVDTASLNLPSP